MKKVTSDLLNKKYFIFDIDGTLIDSMGMWNMVDQMVIFNEIGVEVPLEEIKEFRDSVLYSNQNVHGDIYMIYYGEVSKHFGLNLTAEEYNVKRGELSNYFSINMLDYKPGAEKLLLMLKAMGKKIGIATTTVRHQYDIYENHNQNIISKAPFKELVDVRVLCEDVTRKKPDPEAYLSVVSQFDAKPEECIVFEDSLNGILSAKNAGLEVVAIYDESAQNEQELIDKITDYKVDTFLEFINFLELDKNQSQPS